ncbi:hypothetical protein CVT25_001037 [Psilocybe cyanescens]|uniref:Uncharacterized protein n=1 Tax=Psilocybe cyanescens TaxID=93625 RepID=A0A409XX37_PSICY|nr:hypothetical protein CVT25_001037 [Psilocybe cyanescens]
MTRYAGHPPDIIWGDMHIVVVWKDSAASTTVLFGHLSLLVYSLTRPLDYNIGSAMSEYYISPGRVSYVSKVWDSDLDMRFILTDLVQVMSSPPHQSRRPYDLVQDYGCGNPLDINWTWQVTLPEKNTARWSLDHGFWLDTTYGFPANRTFVQLAGQTSTDGSGRRDSVEKTGMDGKTSSGDGECGIDLYRLGDDWWKCNEMHFSDGGYTRLQAGHDAHAAHPKLEVEDEISAPLEPRKHRIAGVD